MTGLAPDPAVPRRDALLRPPTVAGILSRRLLGGVPVDGCEPLHVKYRFGESLRAVYRFTAGGREHVVAARTFPPGASEARYARALAAAPAQAPPSWPAVVHAPEVDAVLWVFPHDRRLTALPRLADAAALGCERTRLIAYAAERSATAACIEGDEVVAYAKVHTAVAAETALTERVARALGDHPALSVPRVLAADDEVLLLEALPGRRLDGVDALEQLGTALAALHALPLPDARFERLDAGHLATAAAIVARARPDVAGAAERLLGCLALTGDDARRRPVCLHGDANLGNALLLQDGRIGLIDLEHVSAGPAAADLGQLLAGLLLARAQGRDVRGSAAALKSGYARVAEPPDPAALRWYTAASVLARVALPAVGRVRPDTLAHLRPLLEAAADLAARPVREAVA